MICSKICTVKHYNYFVHIVNTVSKVSPEDTVKKKQFVLIFGNTKVVIMQYQNNTFASVLAAHHLQKYTLFWI